MTSEWKIGAHIIVTMQLKGMLTFNGKRESTDAGIHTTFSVHICIISAAVGQCDINYVVSQLLAYAHSIEMSIEIPLASEK